VLREHEEFTGIEWTNIPRGGPIISPSLDAARHPAEAGVQAMDFVIVIVAALVAATAPPALLDPAAAAAVPLTAPTVRFHVYKDAAACEQAAARLTTMPGSRAVCVPVEPLDEARMASAF
jgi:hypothetical protein